MIECVKAWGLEFGGSDRENVVTFLNKLHQCSMSCGFSPQELYRVLPLILKDAAGTWVSVKSTSILSYDEFVTALRKRFSIPAIKCRVLSEIVARTQRKFETGVDFLDSIQSMWRR